VRRPAPWWPAGGNLSTVSGAGRRLGDSEAYIQYEKHLEALRQLRKRGLAEEIKKEKGAGVEAVDF